MSGGLATLPRGPLQPRRPAKPPECDGGGILLLFILRHVRQPRLPTAYYNGCHEEGNGSPAPFPRPMDRGLGRATESVDGFFGGGGYRRASGPESWHLKAAWRAFAAQLREQKLRALAPGLYSCSPLHTGQVMVRRAAK
jgi:hypothetical protein